jgi:hypothetical protein
MNPAFYADTFNNTPVSMFLPVFEPLVMPQVHGSIFPQKNAPSTGKVCTTARFETCTPENKKRNEGHPPRKKAVQPANSERRVNFESWTEVLGSQRLTGALLDRLTHRVHILAANGESFRLKDSMRRQKRLQTQNKS